MMASIAIDFQTPILQTRNHRDTAGLLAIIAKRLEKPRSLPSLLKKRKPLTIKQQQEFLVQSLPGVGAQTAQNLLKKFKTIENIVKASEKELIEVEKIGKLRAKQLKDLFEKEY